MIFQIIMAPTSDVNGAAQRLTGSCQHPFTASTPVQIKIIAFSLAQQDATHPEPLRIDFGGVYLQDVALTTGPDGLAWINPSALPQPFSFFVPATNAVTTVFSSELIFKGMIGTTSSGIPAPPYGMISADVGPADLPNGSSIITGAQPNMGTFQYAILYLDITELK